MASMEVENSRVSVPELQHFYKITADLKDLVDDLVKMKRSGSLGGYKDQVKQCVVKFAALKCANREAHDAADRASCEVCTRPYRLNRLNCWDWGEQVCQKSEYRVVMVRLKRRGNAPMASAIR
jgi:hypothetical protein